MVFGTYIALVEKEAPDVLCSNLLAAEQLFKRISIA